MVTLRDRCPSQFFHSIKINSCRLVTWLMQINKTLLKYAAVLGLFSLWICFSSSAHYKEFNERVVQYVLNLFLHSFFSLGLQFWQLWQTVRNVQRKKWNMENIAVPNREIKDERDLKKNWRRWGENFGSNASVALIFHKPRSDTEMLVMCLDFTGKCLAVFAN